MKRFTLVLIFIFSSISLSQTEDKVQSIELPEFVITGVQSLDVPIVQKKKAEFIPTISEEFLVPTYSPEEFPLTYGSGIIGKKINLFEGTDTFEGGLKIGAGRFTMPAGEFHFSKNWDNYLFSTKVWSKNIRDYIEYAGYHVTGASISNSFFIDNQSGFLPGLRIDLNGNYYQNNFKFYASPTNPSEERKIQIGTALISFTNKYDNTFNYGIDVSGRYFMLSDNDLKELLLTGRSFFELKFQNFGFRLDGRYKQQNLENNLTYNKNYNYFDGKFSVNIRPSNNVELKLGVYYSQQDSNKFFSPVGSFNLRLDKNIYVFGEYSPNTDFYTISDFIYRNKYMVLSAIENIFIKNKSNAKVAVKYEYEKYFEIDAGFNLSNYNNYFFFEDTSTSGHFTLQTVSDISRFAGFINMLFHRGPLGEFYGELNYQQITNSDGEYIPYHPAITASLTYAYYFNFGLGVKIIYDFAHNIFTDMANFNKLNDYHNLAVSISYDFSSNFKFIVDFENVLNRENYPLQGYKEKWFDIIGGLYYHW
ncbi:MAG: hypothetical protein A2V66_01200 [Ignavibacteria bacterium RBG_13_36_8]|nr:MAG: hypothetical protein A2V66_01200 [Ignavibacteria bacterium RBG_13_36_8]